MNEVVTPAAGTRRAALTFIFITVVLDMLALGMIIPVLPKLVVQFWAATRRARRRSTVSLGRSGR